MSQFRGSAYLLAGLCAVALLVSLIWNPPPPPKFVGITAAEIPDKLGDFTKYQDAEMDEETKRQLASASLFSRYYVDNSNALPVNLTIIGGTDRSALHDPRACLVGAGWKLANSRLVPLPGTEISARMCEAINDVTKQKFAMMYVYVVDNNLVTEITQIRMEMALSALLGRKNRPVYFVRFMQEIGSEPQDVKDAEKTMTAFAAETWKSIGGRLQRNGVVTALN